MPENPSLESAVENAVEQTPPVETPVVENSPAETPAVAPVETAPVLDPETEKAVNIYKMLNDPNMGPQVVRMMAEQMGLVQKPEPAAPKKPTAVDFLQKHLGDDYAFLAPKLAGGIEEYIQTVVTPLQQQVLQAQAASEFNAAVSKVNQETKGDFSKFESQILGLMDEIKPGPGVPPDKYLKTLYTIAKSNSAAPNLPPNKVVEKMHRNAQEALPPPSAAERVIPGPKLPSLEDAISAALRGERFE